MSLKIKTDLLLAIDVGNTETVIGVFNGTELLDTWRIVSDVHVTPDEFYLKITSLLSNSQYAPNDFKSIVLSSVVPMLTEIICESRLASEVKPLIVNSTIKSGIHIKIYNPPELGADRIVNALAAKTIYSTNCIVVDFGTATTFDAVTANGDYLGGAIAPGILISSEALFKSGAQLLQVSLKHPSKSVGKNTIESLQSGIIFGFGSLVDGLIERMVGELGWKNPKVIATGGLYNVVKGLSKLITDYDPYLTLKGLQIIHSIQ